MYFNCVHRALAELRYTVKQCERARKRESVRAWGVANGVVKWRWRVNEACCWARRTQGGASVYYFLRWTHCAHPTMDNNNSNWLSVTAYISICVYGANYIVQQWHKLLSHCFITNFGFLYFFAMAFQLCFGHLQKNLHLPTLLQWVLWVQTAPFSHSLSLTLTNTPTTCTDCCSTV